LTVRDDLTVETRHPSTIQVWSLLAFAEPVALSETARFRISAASMRNARLAGFRTEQIEQFLARQAGGRAPADLGARLDARSGEGEGVLLGMAATVEAQSEEQAGTIAALLEADGYLVQRTARTVLVTAGVQRSVATDVERIAALLTAAGIGPLTNRIRV
jgi:hypothetical protein